MTHTPPSEAAASSRSNLPDERALEHIARNEAGFYPAAMQAMAREILRQREAIKVLRDDAQMTHRLIAAKETAERERDEARAELAKESQGPYSDGSRYRIFGIRWARTWASPKAIEVMRTYPDGREDKLDFHCESALARELAEARSEAQKARTDLGDEFRKAMADAEFYRDVYLMGSSLRTAIVELARAVERGFRAIEGGAK